ncbi:acetyltransferase [Corynebacterium hindlerae]|uniref:acyltransferase family protein n=1 Tax=Corynebacterium hindlerae TaxID=699041 RepID=UPI001AD72B6A|nr:acyltransferase family protein [Corynebacterium hindlerae]QTH59612.1 acetyltransferase [Corynebacterium hindlerae]
MNKRIQQIPGIDGLRGLAVISVLLYHFFAFAVPGGFLGVDIFFVLSGFLITSLLVREVAATGRVDLVHFWVRRARRILPAAVFVLVVCTALAGLVGGDPAVGIGTQFTSTLFFVNNWAQIAGSQSYFAQSGVQLFAHYWSLAVEEQFYVLWPLVVAGVCMLVRKRWAMVLAALSLALGAGSFALMLWQYNPDADPTRVYYGTDTHAFGLLTGALLAFLITSRTQEKSFPAPRWVDYVAAALGIPALGVLGYLIVTLPATAPETYRGGLVAASLSTAIVLFSVIRETGPVSWLFRMRWLRWFGDRSFSIYLWHWPILVLVREQLIDVAPGNRVLPGVLAAALSIPLAMWSYTYIENPFRRLGYAGVIKQAAGQFAGARTGALVQHVGAMAVASLAVIAIATAPKQSALETDLMALAAHPQQAAEKAAAVPPPAEVREFPEGTSITAIGDSVMLASLLPLQEKFPGIYVDAAVSRHYTAGIPLLEKMAAEDTLDPFVVLGFGTNGSSFPGQIDQMMQVIGPDRTVVMVMPYGDRAWMPAAQQEIRDAAARYPNVYLADWNGAVMADPSLLREDYIHPSEAGGQAYAEAVAAAITEWVKG